MSDLRSDPAAIVQALQVILDPGQVVELRILNARKGTSSYTETLTGYFDWTHLEDLAKAAAGVTSASGFYWTLNPVKPELHARAFNRLKKGEKGSATADHEIVQRRWFLIDLDAQRPAGISATDAEKATSKAMAQQVRDWLKTQGWPEPVVIDSGNGFHLLYRVSLPADDAGLVKRCLEALALRFSDAAVHVDKTNFNPSRISKLPGTPVRKGDSTPDRPHRMSRLVKVPEVLEVVSTALLEALAGPVEVKADTRPTTPADATFDLAGFVGRHFPDATGPTPYRGGCLYEVTCPWRPSDGQSVHLIQFPSGALDARCQHDTCTGSKTTGNHWKELRAMYEPPSDNLGGEWPDDRQEEPPPHWQEEEEVGIRPLAEFVVSMPDLARMNIPPREMIVDPFLPMSSISMTFAARGVGKTWFVMQLACAITTKSPFFEWHVPEARRVLYVDGEMPMSILQERFSWLYQGNPSDLLDILPSESLWLEDHPLNLNQEGSQKRIQEMLDWMTKAGRRPALIILDNLSSLCSGGKENENDDMDGLLHWLMGLRHQGYAVMMVHHAGKSGEQRGASRREDLLDTSIKLTGTDTLGADGAAFKIEFTKTRGRKPKPEVLEMSLEKGERGEPVWRRVKSAPEFIPTLLAIRDQAPENYTALGKILEISRTAATKRVTGLREKGFVHPMLLTLTEKGRSCAQMFEGVFSAA